MDSSNCLSSRRAAAGEAVCRPMVPRFAAPNWHPDHGRPTGVGAGHCVGSEKAKVPTSPKRPKRAACRDFLELAEIHSRKWQRALQYEQEQRVHLEETIEQLAKQHNSLERAFRGAPGRPANPSKSFSEGSLLTPKGEDSEEDEDTEYFDAMEDSTSFITVITEAKEDR
ncbi:Oxysterol-binding protein 2 [Saguinus oedipus]|uniref:Oxysterol-binding protein 2 n=1 Tax=Saguinus oedipus TaxID=9490 RepID=A0ABQ9WKA5_SAGOE|nr:Oxysterol-binding protein 2 [Saguinus oedipus]